MLARMRRDVAGDSISLIGRRALTALREVREAA
jgi:hypothetical protein